MPLISVIVPVYKVEPYLARCVDSILAQTFRDFELLLVDDGSPDHCGTICDEYAKMDSRVHVLHRENQGVSASRNAGIDWVFANSDSKYIGFVDSDDWVHPRFLELLYKGIHVLHVNISQCCYLSTDGTQDIPEVSEKMKLIDATEHYRDYYSAAVWNKLFSRACWENIRFPVGQIYGEDAAVWYKILLAEKTIALIDEILYYYYQRADSVMKAAWEPKYIARMDTWDDLIALLNQRGDKELLEAVITWYCRIASHEYLAIEESTRLTDAEKKYYQAVMAGKFRKLLVRNHREVKKESYFNWIRSIAFPKYDWCYWTIKGIIGKIKRKK